MIDIVPLDSGDPGEVEHADRLLHILYPGSTHRFEPGQRTDGIEVLLAKSDRQPVGLVVATFINDGWEPYGIIDQLVVHPEHRRKGIGRTLVTEACDFLAERKAVVVFVTTSTTAAERFYRSVGFESTGPWLAWTARSLPS